MYAANNVLRLTLNLVHNLSKQAGKGRAVGAAKHLEFPAGGDQRVIVTRVDNKSPAPQYHNISYYHDVHSN